MRNIFSYSPDSALVIAVPDVPALHEAIVKTPGFDYDRDLESWVIDPDHPKSGALKSKFKSRDPRDPKDNPNELDYIHVPLSERDVASSLGAMYDTKRAQYFVPEGQANKALFNPWRGEVASMLEGQEKVRRGENRQALRAAIGTRHARGTEAKHNPWMTADEVKLKQSYDDLSSFIDRHKSAGLSGAEASGANISAKTPANRTLERSLAMQEQQTLMRAKKMNNMVKTAAKARGIELPAKDVTRQIIAGKSKAKRKARKNAGMEM